MAWSFHGYSRNNMSKFQGSIKNATEFLRVFSKNSCGISMVHGVFYLFEFLGCKLF